MLTFPFSNVVCTPWANISGDKKLVQKLYSAESESERLEKSDPDKNCPDPQNCKENCRISQGDDGRLATLFNLPTFTDLWTKIMGQSFYANLIYLWRDLATTMLL
jgi:hypothetical protein